MVQEISGTTSLVIPIVCETKNCPNRFKVINEVSGIAPEEMDMFFEGYDGSEPEDYCPACGQLGIAQDPVKD